MDVEEGSMSQPAHTLSRRTSTCHPVYTAVCVLGLLALVSVAFRRQLSIF